MECDICFEEFNLERRAPKFVPCGHTVCLQCLQGSERGRCPICRTAYSASPEALPNNFKLMECQDDTRLPRPWCTSCCATATPQCWDEHEVLNIKAALRRRLQAGMLQQATEQLQGLQRQFQEKEAQHALTLLARESWSVTLQGGDRLLTGTLRNSEDPADPLTETLCLLLAARAALTEGGVPKDGQEAGRVSQRHAPGARPAASGPTAATLSEVRPRREMLLGGCNSPDKRKAALRDVPAVTRLVDLNCDLDPDWSLALLKAAAPPLEQLSLYNPHEDHLRVVQKMPRLRRLEVKVSDDDDRDYHYLLRESLKLPALPSGHDGGLQWLAVENLPRSTLQSLLQAHAHSLEELVLTVGTSDEKGKQHWPYSCDDLHILVEQCGLRALRWLTLWRESIVLALSIHHEPIACEEQRDKLRRVLPGAQVVCGKCNTTPHTL